MLLSYCTFVSSWFVVSFVCEYRFVVSFVCEYRFNATHQISTVRHCKFWQKVWKNKVRIHNNKQTRCGGTTILMVILRQHCVYIFHFATASVGVWECCHWLCQNCAIWSNFGPRGRLYLKMLSQGLVVLGHGLGVCGVDTWIHSVDTQQAIWLAENPKWKSISIQHLFHIFIQLTFQPNFMFISAVQNSQSLINITQLTDILFKTSSLQFCHRKTIQQYQPAETRALITICQCWMNLPQLSEQCMKGPAD